MSTGKRYRGLLEERTEAKRQRRLYRVGGLRACRVAAGLTQKELADLVGISQTLIADLETWDSADDATFQRLCRVLKVTPEDLAYGVRVENVAHWPRYRRDSRSEPLSLELAPAARSVPVGV